jgi:hypothetical protein
MGRWIAATLTAVALTGVSACGSPDTFEAGEGTPACRELPVDVVTAVAGDLAADPEGPGGRAPEVGSLPASTTDTGTLYTCQWARAAEDEDGWAVQVTVETTSEQGLTEARAALDRWQGQPLTAAGIQGSGKAYLENSLARAVWTCDYRTLDVKLGSPAEGTDAVTGAKRLAEALIPEAGCPSA